MFSNVALRYTQTHTPKPRKYTHTLLSGWPVAKQDVTKASRKKTPAVLRKEALGGACHWPVPTTKQKHFPGPVF